MFKQKQPIVTAVVTGVVQRWLEEWYFMRSRLRIAENFILKNERTIESVQIGRTPYKNYEPNFAKSLLLYTVQQVWWKSN